MLEKHLTINEFTKLAESLETTGARGVLLKNRDICLEDCHGRTIAKAFWGLRGTTACYLFAIKYE